MPECLRSALAGYTWTPATDGESGGAVHRLDAMHQPSLYLKSGRGRVAQAITAEMARLEWLGPRAAVPKVAQFVALPEEAHLLTTALPGRSAYDCLQADPSNRLETVTAIAQFLRSIHALPVVECPFNSDRALRLAEARRNLDSGRVDEADFDASHEGWTAAQVWEEMMALLPMPFDRVVTHGDFSLGNIFVEDGQVTGCIDVGLAGAADPYQDLSILWHNLSEFGEDLGTHLFRAYGIAEPDWRKVRFHICLDEFF